MTALTLKPDLPETAARFEAWWTGKVLDRPPVTLSIRQKRDGLAVPERVSETLEQRWLDIPGVLSRRVSEMERTHFLGDALPIFWPNLGPVITAALFGARLTLAPTTTWCEPTIHSTDDWPRFLETPADFTNRYWQVVEDMTAAALQAGEGKFLVGMTDLHGNYDILAALRGAENLCLDMVEAPQLVVRAALHAAGAFNQAFARQWKQISARQQVSTCWTPFFHAGPAYVPSCDFWCMVSPKMGRELVLPSILEEMKLLQRSVFHLDGPGALPHLDTLLELPQLHALQWVYGDGHGPAWDWINVQRRAIAAGKSVQVYAENPADAMTMLSALGPQRVWLQVGEPFETVRAASAFLQDIARAARSYTPRP